MKLNKRSIIVGIVVIVLLILVKTITYLNSYGYIKIPFMPNKIQYVTTRWQDKFIITKGYESRGFLSHHESISREVIYIDGKNERHCIGEFEVMDTDKEFPSLKIYEFYNSKDLRAYRFNSPDIIYKIKGQSNFVLLEELKVSRNSRTI